MLKAVLLCVLLWHEMCQFTSRAQPCSTDTAIRNFPALIPRINNGTDGPKIDGIRVTYNINITIFNVNDPSTASTTPSTVQSTTPLPSAPPPTSPPASIPVTTKAPRPIVPGPGYTVTAGIGAHKVHTNRLTWSAARQICIGEGGDLAVIKSNEEEEIAKKMMRDSRAWIGFYRQSGRRGWINVFNQTPAENGWAHWKPNENADGEEMQCVSFVTMSGGGMTTISCDLLRQFICKITTI